ncbi:translation initiation factor IF-2 [Mustela putorius furo]|uniref:Translation initiation factor IF-2 n=1 Tax=Mustela putorius furo TaxID=9669 RepID=A0A8U0SL05_MUSPF|nr:translation initiation factor IF-2 [Mustela putorius furo]
MEKKPAGKPGPQQGSAAARVARAIEAGKGPPERRKGRTLPVLGAGCDYGAAREGPGRGSAAGSRPGEKRGAEGEGRGRLTGSQAPGQAGRARRGGSRRPRAVGQSRRWPRGAAAKTETAGTSPREEPQPERLAEEAKEGRGHRAGDPLTRKQLRPRRRALRDGQDPGLAEDRRLFCCRLRAAPGAVLPLPCAATVSCRRRPGGRVAAWDSGGRRWPLGFRGGPEVG